MEIMIWMVGGILLLNIARLCLAIRQQNKVDELNWNSDAQMRAWNQMCQDILRLIYEVHDERGTDTKTEKVD